MFSIDRRYFRYFDWFSFGITVALSAIGLLFVFGATYRPEQHFSLFFKKQLFGVGSGFLMYLFFCFTDYRRLCRIGYFIYFSVILLLLFTMIKGHIGMGAKRWIDLFIFKFQPSELAKLFFPAFIAHYFETERESGVYQFKDFVPALFVLGGSTLLILKQPDLGTAIILFGSGIILIWLANMPRLFFVISLLLFLVSAPITWRSLKEYQKKRVLVFLGYGDNRSERYQIEQSKIAVGSGGIAGKGFLQGTQNKYLFLPESRTDFIFSVIAEEWGFCGTALVILLFLLLFLRLFFLIATLPNLFAKLLATGLVVHLVLSAIINICMVIGLMPIVGIPLPLISYGVSHLWTTYASLGWLNGIGIARFYVGK